MRRPLRTGASLLLSLGTFFRRALCLFLRFSTLASTAAASAAFRLGATGVATAHSGAAFLFFRFFFPRFFRLFSDRRRPLLMSNVDRRRFFRRLLIAITPRLFPLWLLSLFSFCLFSLLQLLRVFRLYFLSQQALFRLQLLQVTLRFSQQLKLFFRRLLMFLLLPLLLSLIFFVELVDGDRKRIVGVDFLFQLVGGKRTY